MWLLKVIFLYFFSKNSFFVTIFQIEFIKADGIIIVVLFAKTYIGTVARIYNHVIIVKPFS